MTSGYNSNLEPPKAASGWYRDPDDPSLLRFWDGMSWSDHRQSASSSTMTAIERVDLDAEMERAMPVALQQPVIERTGYMTGHMIQVLFQKTNELVDRVNELDRWRSGGSSS